MRRRIVIIAAAAALAAVTGVVGATQAQSRPSSTAPAAAAMEDMPGMQGMPGMHEHAGHPGLAVRQLVAAFTATAPFHSVEAAKRAGYTVLFQDRLGFTCITDLGTPSQGAMGFHYVNPANIGSTDPSRPAAVLYEPDRHGRLHLVALEYLVVEPQQQHAPVLFGQPFMFTPAGDASVNRFMPDAFYSLHAWLWKHNPSGPFAMWNPRVSCANA
jgi:hypothetical protein